MKAEKQDNVGQHVTRHRSSQNAPQKRCDFSQITVGLYKTSTEPGKRSLDFIHSDVQSLFEEVPKGFKYLVTFHCDFEERFYMSLLRFKARMFLAFFNYKKQNDYDDKRIKRWTLDNEGEYNFVEFQKFWFENGIQWKPLMLGNSKPNDKTERLGRILHEIASTMRVDVEVVKNEGLNWYWRSSFYETDNQY